MAAWRKHIRKNRNVRRSALDTARESRRDVRCRELHMSATHDDIRPRHRLDELGHGLEHVVGFVLGRAVVYYEYSLHLIQNGVMASRRLVRGFVERGSHVPGGARQPARIFVEPDFPGRLDLGHENYLPGVHGEVLHHVIDRA